MFSCRQLDSEETYLANVSTGCSSPPQNESEAESRNLEVLRSLRQPHAKLVSALCACSVERLARLGGRAC